MILGNKRDREAWFREKTISSLKANEFLELEDLALVAETNCFYKIVSEVTAIKLDKGELYAKSLGYKVEGIDWDSIIGKPTTFPAEKHEHPEYVTSEVMNIGLASKAPVSHEHNLLYYGKNEIDTKLEGKLSKNDPAISANKLSTPRNISLRGNVNGSASFDGQSDISISTIVNSIDASKLTTGTISVDRLPKVALDNLVKVKNPTERLLLTKDTVQNGDTVKELDTNKLFLVVDDNKLNLEEGYQEYSAATDWSSITDKPNKFPSEEHTHTKEEITNFPIALRNPYDLSISINGIKKCSYNGNIVTNINISNEDLNVYNKNEVDNKLSSKSNEGHSHSSLIIRNGSNFVEYDGTSEKEINITAGGETPAAHVHASNEVTLMTGYSKSSYTGAVSTSDNLNRAIAKLENRLDTKASSTHSHSEYANSSDVYAALRAKANVEHSHSGYATSTHTHTAGAVGAYTKAEVESKLSGKANSSHGNHVPATQSANNKVYLRNDNTWHLITPADIGAQPAGKYASSDHTHDYLPLTGGNVSGAITLRYNTGIRGGSVDDATLVENADGANLIIESWYGVGFRTTFDSGKAGTTLVINTRNGDLQAKGNITANVVYNAVWNDYAELFEKGEDTEPGDIICLDTSSPTEQYIKADSSSKRVIGVHSDTYGHLIGGEKLENFEDNFEKFIPIGLAGRVNVKVKGKVELGDYIVPSEEKGIGRAYNKDIDDRDLIIGYLVETDNREDVRRLKMFINKK